MQPAKSMLQRLREPAPGLRSGSVACHPCANVAVQTQQRDDWVPRFAGSRPRETSRRQSEHLQIASGNSIHHAINAIHTMTLRAAPRQQSGSSLAQTCGGRDIACARDRTVAQMHATDGRQQADRLSATGQSAEFGLNRLRVLQRVHCMQSLQHEDEYAGR